MVEEQGVFFLIEHFGMAIGWAVTLKASMALPIGLLVLLGV